MLRIIQKKKIIKQLDQKLVKWRNNGQKGSPSAAVGMSHSEFQDWIYDENKIPERFFK
jgi:hypothetical protein